MKNKLPNDWIETNFGDKEYFEILPSGIKDFKSKKEYLSTESIKKTKIEKIECEISYNNRPSRANMQPILNSVWFAKMKSTLKVYCFDKKNNVEVDKYILSTGFTGIRVNEEKVDVGYLRAYLLTSNFNSIKDSYCSGATQKSIGNEKISKINILIPPLETQKQIVEVLERAERIKEKRKRANELLAQYLKSVFYEIFGDPTKNEKKWDIKPLKEFGEIKTGNTPPRVKKEYYGNYIEWIKSDNLNNPETYLTEAEEWLSEAGSKVGRVVSKRSVLVTCIAGSPSCIGNAGITNRDVAFNQQINAITPKDEVNELFLYYLITYSKKYMLNFSTQSMKGMISKGTFEQIPFIYPPKDIQYRFGKIANQIERVKNKQNQSDEKISNLYNTLMQKAFIGELVK